MDRPFNLLGSSPPKTSQRWKNLGHGGVLTDDQTLAVLMGHYNPIYSYYEQALLASGRLGAIQISFSLCGKIVRRSEKFPGISLQTSGNREYPILEPDLLSLYELVSRSFNTKVYIFVDFFNF